MTLENTIRKHGVEFELLGETHGKTHKELGVDEIIQDALKNNVDTIVTITSGNYGLAIKKAIDNYNKTTKGKKLKAIFIVDSESKTKDYLLKFRQLELDKANFRLYENPRMKDFWFDVPLREFIVKDRFEDCGNVKDYTNFIPKAYYEHARDILLNKNLDYLALPVGSGKLFVAFYKALEELKNEGKGIKTKLIGVVPKGKNPIYHTFVYEEPISEVLRKEFGVDIPNEKLERIKIKRISKDYKGESLADKLPTPGTDFLDEIKEAMSKGHKIIEIDEKQIKKANRRFYKENLEYSASVAGSLLEKKVLKKLDIEKDKEKVIRIGIYRTGSGVYTTNEYELAKIRKEKTSHAIKKGGIIATSVLGAGLLLYIISPYLQKIKQRMMDEYRELEKKLLIFDHNNDGSLDMDELFCMYSLIREKHDSYPFIGKTIFSMKTDSRTLSVMRDVEKHVTEVRSLGDATDYKSLLNSFDKCMERK